MAPASALYSLCSKLLPPMGPPIAGRLVADHVAALVPEAWHSRTLDTKPLLPPLASAAHLPGVPHTAHSGLHTCNFLSLVSHAGFLGPC